MARSVRLVSGFGTYSRHYVFVLMIHRHFSGSLAAHGIHKPQAMMGSVAGTFLFLVLTGLLSSCSCCECIQENI